MKFLHACAIGFSASFVFACSKGDEQAAPAVIAAPVVPAAKQDRPREASVAIDAEGTRATMIDKDGRTSSYERGSVKVSEAELGLPFYPGAHPVEGSAAKQTTPEGTLVMTASRSSDSMERVASFYRSRLKDIAAGRQIVDTSGAADGIRLMLISELNGASEMKVVDIRPQDGKTEIHLVASHATQP